MKNTKEYSEKELLELATGLYVDGFRYMEIYKYLKERTEDTELVSRIIETIKSNEKANEKREEEIKIKNNELNYLTGSNPYFDLIMGIFIIIFGVVFSKLLLNSGVISTLSIVLFIGGLVLIFRGIKNLSK